MTEAEWKRLLNRMRDGDVVPVLGSQLLVDPATGASSQAWVAESLLGRHGQPVEPGSLPACRELNEAFERLSAAKVRTQDIYADVHELMRERNTPNAADLPTALKQIAQIADFRLLVTLTPDDGIARALRLRCAVNEIVHSPSLPTGEQKDLPTGWIQRAGEVQLLYLFGKARSTPMFAIHDEDVLEYAHNIISSGSQVPTAFLGELRQRSLLLIGCNFPDWLSRFFLRLTNRNRLSIKDKREWLVEQLPQPESLTCFLRSHSRETEVLAGQSPTQFVAELHRRWMADHAGGGGELPSPKLPSVPPTPLFFISYSRRGDLPFAEALVQTLIELGASPAEVWFDRTNIEPGHDYRHSILDGIRGCTYFVPLLSDHVVSRSEAFVFSEWREANERLKNMNREFVLPVIVDSDYQPERYSADAARPWSDIDHGHAPRGVVDGRLRSKLTKLLRDARRGTSG